MWSEKEVKKFVILNGLELKEVKERSEGKQWRKEVKKRSEEKKWRKEVKERNEEKK